ncbi:MAG: hypothetical protein ABUL49_01725, partial [bacterium]
MDSASSSPSPKTAPKLNPELLFLLVASFVLVALQTAYQIRLGINMGDEGFLWYGAQRVLAGEVPMRDFMAYEPIRYHLTALPMFALQSKGIVAARIGMALFEWVGVFFGTLAISRALRTPSRVFLTLCMVVLMIWIGPRYKTFDIAVSIFLVPAAVYLFERRNVVAFCVLGLAIGLAATIGKQHGFYGILVVIEAAVLLKVTDKSTQVGKGLLRTLLWIAIGYLPVIVMVLFVPGFFNAMVHSVTVLFENKTTNLAIPIPWPWTSKPGWVIDQYLTGVGFVLLPVFAAATVLYTGVKVIQKKPPSPFVMGCGIVALPYMHYAFSRADLSHLTLSIGPLLVGGMYAIGKTGKWWRLLLSLPPIGTSYLTMTSMQPGAKNEEREKYLPVSVLGDNLEVDQGNANLINTLQFVDHQFNPRAKSSLVVPMWPAGSAVLAEKAALWEFYPLVSRTPEYQKDEIEQIKRNRPGFILITNFPLDGTDRVFYHLT